MISILRTSFTGGEWSTTFWARNDIQKYDTGNRCVENFHPHPAGKAMSRFGSKMMAAAKYQNKESMLVRFQFSVSQLYFLEFGDHYIRFYKDDNVITLPDKQIASITASNPCTVSCLAHGFSNGDHVIITNVSGMTRLNGNQFIVANATTNTFTLQDLDSVDIDSSNYPPAVNGTGVAKKIYEIASPYSESDIWKIRFDQSADVILLWHPSITEKQLTRTGHTSWTLDDTEYGSTIAAPVVSSSGGSGKKYVVTTIDDASREESRQSNEVTGAVGSVLTWPAVTGAYYYNIYEVIDGFAQYLGQTKSATYTTPNATPDATKGPPENYNPFTGEGKYPASGGFYQQRVIRVRTNDNPATMYASQIANIFNLDRHHPVEASDGFDLTISQTTVQEIQWILGLGKKLFIGTTAYEFLLAPASTDQAVSAKNLSGLDQPIGNIGSCSLPAILVDNSCLFVNASRQKIIDQSYEFTNDAYQGSDLCYFAEHLFSESGIKQYALRRNPFTIIYALRDDGVLCGMTFLKQQQVWGWFREITDGDVKSISASDDRDGNSKVCMIVKRTINGKTRRYVESKVPRPAKCAPKDEWCVDCGSRYDGPATQIITGLDYLEGKTVAINADGNLVFGKVVINGQVELPEAASRVTVGLPYKCRLETTDLDVQTQAGSLVAKSRTINNVTLRLENTRECNAGSSGSKELYPLKLRKDEDWGEPTEPFTGDYPLSIDPPDPMSSRLVIEVDAHAPCTVLAIIGDVSYVS